MKKITILFGLLIVLISAFFWYYKSNKTIEISNIIPSSQNDISILLYAESGDVSFKTKPDGDFQKVVSSPTSIPNQSIIHTNTGKASVLLPDNSTISLDNNTEITVNYSPKKTSIYQSAGATYHRVSKLISGQEYQVQTQGTLAAVRGTKFAVKYDTKNKKTKIAVTESKVEVSTIPKNEGTTTPKVTENILVEAGKTVSVLENLALTPSVGKSALQVVDTNNDSEMNIYVEKEKKIDLQLENIKKDNPNQEDFRKEMKRLLFNDKEDDKSKNDDQDKQEIDNNTENDSYKKEVKDIEVIKKDEVKKTEEVEKPIIKEEIKETLQVQKMGEEEFFTVFEPLFIKYFYIDDTDSVCNLKISPIDRVKAVASFASSKGYPFVKESLTSFAEEIDKYCINKDKDTKTRLQGRFDDEYPF